jgi:hypothetical protein
VSIFTGSMISFLDLLHLILKYVILLYMDNKKNIDNGSSCEHHGVRNYPFLSRILEDIDLHESESYLEELFRLAI